MTVQETWELGLALGNLETLELALVLAELDSQLKARKTAATIEETNELFCLIKERRAAARAENRRPMPGGEVHLKLNWGMRPAVIMNFPDGSLRALAITQFGGDWVKVDITDVTVSGKLALPGAFDALVLAFTDPNPAKEAGGTEKSKSPQTFALVEEGTSRVWLFLSSGGSVMRLLDGTWVDEPRADDEVIMPDELGDFRYASENELCLLLLEAAASPTISSTIASAALQAEKQQPGSVKPWKTMREVSHETIRYALHEVEGGLPEHYYWGGVAEACLIAAAKQAERYLLQNIETVRVFVEDPRSIPNQFEPYHRAQKRAFRESQIALVALRWVKDREVAPFSEDRIKERQKAIEKLWKYRQILTLL